MPTRIRIAQVRRGLRIGLGCLAASAGPLLGFLLLQSIGLIGSSNSGLGCGLWFFFTMPVALLVLVAGIIYDARRAK